MSINMTKVKNKLSMSHSNSMLEKGLVITQDITRDYYGLRLLHRLVHASVQNINNGLKLCETMGL